MRLERDYNTIFGKRWKICPQEDGWQSDITIAKHFYLFALKCGVNVNNRVGLNQACRPDFIFYMEITIFRWRCLFRSYHRPLVNAPYNKVVGGES